MTVDLRHADKKERPWGAYFGAAVAFLILTWAVCAILLPIVDPVEARDKLGIDRVRIMLQEEHSGARPVKPAPDPTMQSEGTP
ncbi:MAG TPA: hypothetical protein PKH07_10990 [bacterium]|nr:hypothetical protein [bacterium]